MSADEPASDLPPGYPRPLVDFMLRGWRPPRPASVRPLPEAADHARRRAALAARFPGEVLVVPSGAAPVRSNDTHFRFRPGSDLYYLTGNTEPDTVLVIGRDGASVLHVEAVVGREGHGFFTDRQRGALWVGPRLGVEGSARRYGLRCAGLDTLADTLSAAGPGPIRVLRGLCRDVEDLVDRAAPEPAPAGSDAGLGAAIAELRLIKDAGEVAALRAAIASTRRGVEDVIAALPRARSERDLEVAFTARARREGNDVGYGVIAAAGPHATILHWHDNDGPIPRQGLLLLDAGVEGRKLYTADITRTFPVCGRFSPDQLEVYALVEAGWRAAIAAVRPGVPFSAPYEASLRAIVPGLVRMGLFAHAGVALDPRAQLHKRYTLHVISHMLGLDVHDCARAPAESYKAGVLRPGMVLTIEPGLYFQRDDATVPRRLRGLGVRIEDDVLVTDTGAEILSAAIPREAREVERWMARVWRRAR